MGKKQTTDVDSMKIALRSRDRLGFRLLPDELLVVGSQLSTEGERLASDRGINDENVGIDGLGAESSDAWEEWLEERRRLELFLETLQEERELARMKERTVNYPEGGVMVITLL